MSGNGERRHRVTRTKECRAKLAALPPDQLIVRDRFEGLEWELERGPWKSDRWEALGDPPYTLWKLESPHDYEPIVAVYFFIDGQDVFIDDFYAVSSNGDPAGESRISMP